MPPLSPPQAKDMIVVDDFAEGAFASRKTKDVVAALGRWGANVMAPKGKETCLLITDDVRAGEGGGEDSMLRHRRPPPPCFRKAFRPRLSYVA